MNIEMPRGDQKLYSFKLVTKKTKQYISQVDEMYITFREQPYKSSPVLFQKKLEDVEYDSETNKWKFWIKTEDTENLDYGTYGYDIEVTIGELKTTKTGLLTLTDEYTMEE